MHCLKKIAFTNKHYYFDFPYTITFTLLFCSPIEKISERRRLATRKVFDMPSTSDIDLPSCFHDSDIERHEPDITNEN